jgi:hypothetical protein
MPTPTIEEYRRQGLIVTAGLGRVQRSGGPVEEIRPLGDVTVAFELQRTKAQR